MGGKSKGDNTWIYGMIIGNISLLTHLPQPTAANICCIPVQALSAKTQRVASLSESLNLADVILISIAAYHHRVQPLRSIGY